MEPPRRDEEMRARGEEQIGTPRPQVGPPPPSFARPDPAPREDQRHEAMMDHGARNDRPTGRPTLFSADESGAMRSRWTDIQAAFVDEPREAVRRADALVNDATRRVTEVFASERAALEKQWDRGDEVTTEDLRMALQRYRAFFDHLLSL